jgi:putative ribosome biogenesis GTPase RsgA
MVMEKFDKYFIPRRNVIHECACFYQGCQHSGESGGVIRYIMTLYEILL